MPESLTCQKCGAPLGRDARLGCCPSCLFAEAAGNGLSSGDESDPSPALRRMGDYELLEVLGRGGMGVVYKARQVSLGRYVAVKLLIAGDLASPEFIKRLRVEATTAGCLQHPNIVGIHEIGIHQDQHYLVMDYVAGSTLAARMGSSPMPARTAAGLLKIIAEAVHHAHTRGVLHRDLKPSNILLDEQDRPRITDFGLAKRFTSDSITTEPFATGQEWVTLEGQVVGSPNYMPPEQASPDHSPVSRAGDVYSLGAILYHMLTGRPPFLGETIPATLRAVVEDEPISPRLINPAIPRDLETICLKCLEKEPERRYPTALALGQDLDAFLTEQPIRARPVSPWERAWRWCCRHRLLATLLGTTLVLLVVVAVGSPVALIRIQKERTLADQQRRRAVAGEAAAVAQLYAARMNLIEQAWEQGNSGRLRQLLEETRVEAPAPEWRFWWGQMHRLTREIAPQGASIRSLAVSRDGQFLASAGEDGNVQLRSAASGEVLRTLRGHVQAVRSVRWFLDGQRLASAGDDHTVRLWRSADGAATAVLKPGGGRIAGIAISPDDAWLATANQNGTVTLFSMSDGSVIGTLEQSAEPALSVAFAPDGRTLAVGSADYSIRVWQVAGRQRLLTLRGHKDYVRSVAFSPDGTRLVTASDDATGRVWNATTGECLLTLDGHAGEVSEAVFTPDGQRVVTVGEDFTARFWDAASGKELRTVSGHHGALNAVCFSQDGRTVFTGGDDMVPVAWNASGEIESLFMSATGPVASLAAFPGGDLLAIGVEGGRISLRRTADGVETGLLQGDSSGRRLRGMVLSRDGRLLASAFGPRASIFDVATGREIAILERTPWINALAFSPDGRRLVVARHHSTLVMWNLDNGSAEFELESGHQDSITSVAFSPDGQWICTGGRDGNAAIFHSRTGQRQALLKHHTGAVHGVAVSPDGRWIATASSDLTACLWDTARGYERLVLRGHASGVTSVAFTSDGARVVTGSADRTVKVWNSRDGAELLTLRVAAPVSSVAVSPDIRHIVAGSADGRVTLWRAPELGPGGVGDDNTRHNRQLQQMLRQRELAEEEERARRASDPGVVREWLILGPIPFPYTREITVLDQPFLPGERELQPRAGDRHKSGPAGLGWTEHSGSARGLSFATVFGRKVDYAAAYAVTYVHSDADQSGLLMHVGSDDAALIYLNGKQVYRTGYRRSFILDEDVLEGIALKQGVNVLVFKIINFAADGVGSIRFSHADGTPLRSIKASFSSEPP